MLQRFKEYSYLLMHINGDIDTAELFAELYKDKLRYIPEAKSFYFHNGIVWQQDIEGMQARKYVKEFAIAVLDYLVGNETTKDADIKYYTSFLSPKKRISLIEDAKSVFPVSISEFDTSVTTLNCLNGTLKFGVNKYCHRFTEHKPEDMLSKVANVNYVPDARCERWEQFVSDIMQGRQELIDFLQMSAGYALTGLTNYECFFILYGSTTRNGKGTFCETLLHLLGDYGRTAQAESIACKSFSNGSAPNEDIARLRGARFVNISEPAKDLYLNSALVKALTGNDTICARYLHQNSFEYKPQFKMFINTNHLPQVEDDSLFASGRVKLIPFERHFEANEQDTSLKAKFRQQDAMSGILNWCIEGLDKLMQAGELRSPQVMVEAVEEYRSESDTIKNFMQDILIADTYERVKTSILYKAYGEWCRANGFNILNNRDFMKELRRVATVKRHNTLGNIVEGYKINKWYS